MINRDELIAIFDRVVQGTGTPAEIGLLRRSLRMVGDEVQFAPQDGSVTINIGTIAGGNVQIGDRSYQIAAVEQVLLSPEKQREAVLALLEAIEAQFNTVSLFHTGRAIVLKDQYIPIQVTLERPSYKVVENFFSPVSEAELSRAYALKRGADEATQREQVDWQQAKARHSRLMVLADPGMGKSTLLRMEALTTAQQERQRLAETGQLEQVVLPL